MKKFINTILEKDIWRRFLRIFFAFLFVLFTLTYILSSDKEAKNKALTHAAFNGVCFLIQDACFKKQHRWLNGD